MLAPSVDHAGRESAFSSRRSKRSGVFKSRRYSAAATIYKDVLAYLLSHEQCMMVLTLQLKRPYFSSRAPM